MNFKKILFDFAAFVNKHQRGILYGFMIICLFQQCKINSLQREVAFLSDLVHAPTAPALEVPDVEVPEDVPDVPSSVLPDVSEPVAAGEFPLVWAVVGAVVVALGIYGFMAYRKGWWPLGVRLKGKLWQDLYGRVNYTLTVRNLSKLGLTVSDAQIEFIRMGSSRKFRIPLADFPLAMCGGTSHTVNISLQKLLESHADLLDYKVIRLSVMCKGRRVNTLPLGVRWKR